MNLSFNDLLKLVPKEAERRELNRLGREYAQAAGQPAAAARTGPMLDEIMKQIQHHFRAIRHPLPTRAQVEQMMREAFP
jgi:hypothetical protein